MGFVIKTIRSAVGEVNEDVCYHFEVFEDFMAFEKQEKMSGDDSPEEVALITTLPVEESEYETYCGDDPRCVTEIIEGKKYRIKGNDVSCHNFSTGEIVTASEDSNHNDEALCETEKERWWVHASEVEPID